MKKFLILLLLTSSVALSTIPYLEAADEVLVTVTEKIPGADCKCIVDGNAVQKDDQGNDLPPAYSEANCGNVATRKYECKVSK